MRWKRVAADRVQPNAGTYSDWKTDIANDCSQQCVYCAISESAYGGIDNFHIDHFKPISRFEELANIITNLFLACAICNRFKSDDWPGEHVADHSQPSYPDPSAYDYNDLFEVNRQTFEVSGHFRATAYIAQRLYLNRPQLLMERRAFFLNERIIKLNQSIRNLLDSLKDADLPNTAGLLDRLLRGTLDLEELTNAAARARPYERDDVRRPN